MNEERERFERACRAKGFTDEALARNRVRPEEYAAYFMQHMWLGWQLCVVQAEEDAS